MANENIFSGIVFDDGGKGNKYQPDVPAVGATEMKAILDALPDHIISQLNSNLSTMSQRIVQYVGEAEGEAGLGNMNTSDYCVSLIPIVKSNPDFDVIVFDMVAYNDHFKNAGTITYHSDGSWSAGAMAFPAIYNEGLGRWESTMYGIAYTDPPNNLDTLTYGEPVLEKKRPVDWALVADTLSSVEVDDLVTQDYVDDEIARVETQIRDQIVDYIVDDGHALTVEDWVESNGIFSQSIGGTSDTIDVTSTDHPRIYPNYQDDPTEYGEISDAWGEVTAAIAGDGTITFYCSYNKPAVDIPLIIEVIRSTRSEGGGS